MVSVAASQLCSYLNSAKDYTKMNEHSSVSIAFYLWKLKSKFMSFSHAMKYPSLELFLQLLKYVKSILS